MRLMMMKVSETISWVPIHHPFFEARTISRLIIVLEVISKVIITKITIDDVLQTIIRA